MGRGRDRKEEMESEMVDFDQHNSIPPNVICPLGDVSIAKMHMQIYIELFFSLLSSANCFSGYVQVNGCLSYTDKISDGFYNILGMNPHVWAMCNDFEAGRRIPSLTSLKAVSPNDTAMEVVLVDKRGDLGLKELQDRAQELSSCLQNTLGLVEQLGKLVSLHLG